MKTNDCNKFIFYILLENKIPEAFYQFDNYFKKIGWTLIPIAFDQIQMLGSISEQGCMPVLCSTQDFQEFKSFNKNVRDVLKFLLKSEKFMFFKISSFEKLNDEKYFFRFKNYFFIRYPQNVRAITLWVEHLFELKSNHNKSWPGGKRVGANSLTI